MAKKCKNITDCGCAVIGIIVILIPAPTKTKYLPTLHTTK
jgi:hypothetical protein